MQDAVKNLTNIASGQASGLHQAIGDLQTRIDTIEPKRRKELMGALEPLKKGIESLKYWQTSILEIVGEIEKSVNTDKNDGRPSGRNQ